MDFPFERHHFEKGSYSILNFRLWIHDANHPVQYKQEKGKLVESSTVYMGMNFLLSLNPRSWPKSLDICENENEMGIQK